MKTLHKLLSRLVFALSLASSTFAIAEETPLLLHAARVFDGTTLKTDTSVLISGGKITQIDKRDALKDSTAKVIDLGDATLLPAFIELHAHLAYHHIPADTVLRHGIGTLRDVGGVVHQPYGGDGSLRVLTSGQIITAPNGYPIPQMGADNIAITVANEAQARQTVQELINGGAVIIKIALEVGNEVGAPWSSGVDEWAHIPCDATPEKLLKQAVAQKVKIVTTFDTLSKCSGGAHNAHTWASLGGEFLYGAEIAHPDIPWGVDAQELNMMMHLAKLSPLEVLHITTANAGEYLNIPC